MASLREIVDCAVGPLPPTNTIPYVTSGLFDAPLCYLIIPSRVYDPAELLGRFLNGWALVLCRVCLSIINTRVPSPQTPLRIEPLVTALFFFNRHSFKPYFIPDQDEAPGFSSRLFRPGQRLLAC